MIFIILIVGLFLLVKGADWLVDGSSALAKRFGISSIVIGLTIVAFGTSAPELVINLVSVFQGNTQIAIGNIVGSNIANILLILGVSASIYPLSVKTNTVWKEIPLALLASLVLALMANDTLIEGAPQSVISRIDGLILLSFFIIFLYYTKSILSDDVEADADTPESMSVPKSATMIAGGFISLIAGAKMFVDGAVSVAGSLGVSEALIGLTVVAIGTSLPELVTSVVAAYKKETDIAIGNVVGSNIFNIFGILGISSVIKPLPLIATNNPDFLVCIGASLILFIALFIGKRHQLERWQGYAFILLYAVYIVALSIRG